ncbi:hypothetical protein ARC96_13750 [Escherichia coli]|uniref:hypothetical protein n=1 Tax=Escherichia coli TaxID=562 RepID=UPI000749098A|nr:hypothetical protein [Escherichia coli]KUG70482.1 hypothetical protein ARC81_14730 [Escherichia coli]KUG71867.1 hypothetical protein ARC96_13750 [Escherichia coli]
MVNSINFIIINVFAIMILTPFVNEGVIARYEVPLNFIYPVFLFFCIIRLFLIKTQFRYKIILVWLILSALLLSTIIISLYLSPVHNKVINIQILSIICGLICSIPLLDSGLVNEINDKLYKYLIIYCFIGLIICLGSIELVEKGFQTATRSIYFSSPISISIVAGLGIIALAHVSKKNILNLPAIVLLFFVMYIMSSRGPLIALLLCCLLYMLKNANVITKILSTSLLVIMVPLILNIRSTVGESNLERELILRTATKLIIDTPLVGYLGRFNTETGMIFSHNLIVDFLIDLGMLQTVWFIVIITMIFILYFKKKNASHLSIMYVYIYILFCLFFSLPAIEMLKIYIPLSIASLTLLSTPLNNNTNLGLH